MIKLKNGKEYPINELNQMIRNFDCEICQLNEEQLHNAENSKCSECLNGDNYISYFEFIGISEGEKDE